MDSDLLAVVPLPAPMPFCDLQIRVPDGDAVLPGMNRANLGIHGQMRRLRAVNFGNSHKNS